MNAIAPSSLPSAALARRLADLCGEERNVQADFLLHLSEFDLRRAYLEAGYGSLWVYCLEALHLREGAAGRRIGAMKVLRKFPALEVRLREGRVCLSTMNLLGPVLTEQNLEDLVARAAFKSKADTEKLVASIQPRGAPREGLRRLPGSGRLELAGGAGVGAGAEVGAACGPAVAPGVGLGLGPATAADDVAAPGAGMDGRGLAAGATAGARVARGEAARHLDVAGRFELRPISADLYSLRVTIDERCKQHLDQLVSLLSHTTRGNLADVLREAIRCGIEKHGKRKGAVEPERKSAAAAPPPAVPRAANAAHPSAAHPSAANPHASNASAANPHAAKPSAANASAANPHAANAASPIAKSSTKAAKRFDPRAIPIAVRRAVWKRDGGICAWTARDGKRCGSTWKLELDHIEAAAFGGAPTIDNLRVTCKSHNLLHAVRTFGPEVMAPYLGGFAIAGESDSR